MAIEVKQEITIDTGSSIIDHVCQNIITDAADLPANIKKKDNKAIAKLLEDIQRNIKLIDNLYSRREY